MSRTAEFLAGVIEGFYGPPWTQSERFQLFDWMQAWGLNTYLYAPKDDLKQRASWRELYSAAEASNLKELITACAQRGIRFVYAVSPGLDIRYRIKEETHLLQSRFQQILDLGCRHFSLLFDDIPDAMDPEDLKQFGSLASAQAHVTNALFKWLRDTSPDARLLFCPTPYCGRMAKRNLGGEGYLATIGRELIEGIDIFWTGPEIISREITVEHVRELQTLLRRPPLIWDNLHANDYDGRRFFCGPYAGRPLGLKKEVTGLLLNPNNEFSLNYVPFRTLGSFLKADSKWNPREAYLDAMKEWLRHFETVGQPVKLEDLVLLGDCYYLPFEEGPEAQSLYEHACEAVKGTTANYARHADLFQKQAGRLRDLCARLSELRDRNLFYALSRRLWELREELDLLRAYVAVKAEKGSVDPNFAADSALMGTFRGGLVPKLQRLLIQRPDGTLAPFTQDTTSCRAGSNLDT